jgi:hypothetical protein
VPGQWVQPGCSILKRHAILCGSYEIAVVSPSNSYPAEQILGA